MIALATRSTHFLLRPDPCGHYYPTTCTIFIQTHTPTLYHTPQCVGNVFSATWSQKTDFWPSFQNNRRRRFDPKLMARDRSLYGRNEECGSHGRVGRNTSDKNIIQRNNNTITPLLCHIIYYTHYDSIIVITTGFFAFGLTIKTNTTDTRTAAEALQECRKSR